MSLGETRRNLRIMSLETAASMIEDYHAGGLTPEDIGLTDDELDVLIEENKRTARRLYLMAEKLKRGNQ